MKPTITHADLQQFTGDSERFRHSLNPQVIYTPGVRFLAERGEAYWLINVIASYVGSELMQAAQQHDARLQSLQFWRLDVGNEQTALLTARADDGVEPFLSQPILWTDFPLDHVAIWAGFDGEYWTLYLPSEH